MAVFNFLSFFPWWGEAGGVGKTRPPKSPQCWGDFNGVVYGKLGGWGWVGPLNPPYMGDFKRWLVEWVVMVSSIRG